MKFTWQGHCLDFCKKTHLMGILNITPDSFSDGGLHFDKDQAIKRAHEMLGQGADIIDVGGQSTRPGSEPVGLDEELRRTVPVIEALRASGIKAPISIDTYSAAVAKAALNAGASMINDISGLRFDPEMAKLAAGREVPVILMHIKGTPRDMQSDPQYEALIPEILNYLRVSIRMAESAGLRPDLIAIDPGIGFGKTFSHNLHIIKNLGEFTGLQKPVLVGPSRKAFLGHLLGDAPPSDRLEGTAAAVAACVLNGASIVRVHDVSEMVKVVKVADAIKRGS